MPGACAGHPRLAGVAKDEDVDGRASSPAMTDFQEVRGISEATAYAASAALAFSAIAWNAAGSWIARSDSTLRSTVMPDLARPLMNTL